MEKNYPDSKISAKEITDKWHLYAKSGKAELIAEIYKNSKELIYFVAYKILLDKGLAHDILQDVFLQIISLRKNYQEVEDFYPWLRTIAKHAALAKKKQIKTHLSIEDLMLEEGLNTGKLETWESKIEILKRAISQMKRKNYKEILTWELEGLSNLEIAERLGKSEKYVRDRKSLAKKELVRIV